MRTVSEKKVDSLEPSSGESDQFAGREAALNLQRPSLEKSKSIVSSCLPMSEGEVFAKNSSLHAGPKPTIRRSHTQSKDFPVMCSKSGVTSSTFPVARNTHSSPIPEVKISEISLPVIFHLRKSARPKFSSDESMFLSAMSCNILSALCEAKTWKWKYIRPLNAIRKIADENLIRTIDKAIVIRKSVDPEFPKLRKGLMREGVRITA